MNLSLENRSFTYTRGPSNVLGELLFDIGSTANQIRDLSFINFALALRLQKAKGKRKKKKRKKLEDRPDCVIKLEELTNGTGKIAAILFFYTKKRRIQEKKKRKKENQVENRGRPKPLPHQKISN
ncbi:hypothetical protein ACN38_g11880 [Penicillium nordicum]|uniref:Uncharacterized protein n=1 Tax=Penicillium nordicum TaxID=229535 RepID=A0A0M8NZ49_9EURO|nr:hypothetical protein ACN38_g11880 [Penicillium nordicum]